VLGSRICIVNLFANGVKVSYTTKDSNASRKGPFYYEGDLPKDTETCAEESSTSPPADVAGNLVIPGQSLPFTFGGFNAFLGPPEAWIAQRRDDGLYYCTNNGFDVGDTQLWDNGVVRMSITRQNDDQYKEFLIRLESSQGQRVGDDPCTEPDGPGWG